MKATRGVLSTFLPIVLVAVAAYTVCLVGCSADSIDSSGNRPLFQLTEERGFSSDADDFIKGLNDEQLAAIDISYEADTASGFQGSKADWVKDKLRGRIDSNGDLIVVLPDGAEFTVSKTTPSEEKAAVAPGVETESALGVRSGTSGGTDGESAQSKSSEIANPVARILVDDVSVRPGDKDVVASVRVEGNPGIAGLTVSLSFDESVLTLKSVENGDAFKDVLTLTHSPSLDSGCLFTWDGVDVAASDVRDGSALLLRFDVSDKAAPGFYPLVANVDQAVTNDLAEIALAVENGNVVVD